MFKSVDEKLKELGFEKKSQENEYGVTYERQCDGYLQWVSIMHKANGNHILQSYDPELFDEKKIGNTCVGLTYTELRLFTKKMKQLGWKS